jgi:hypothetical protein
MWGPRPLLMPVMNHVRVAMVSSAYALAAGRGRKKRP